MAVRDHTFALEIRENGGTNKRPPAVRQHRYPGALPTNKESTSA